MIDRDSLRVKPVPYLGWYLEGEPGPAGTGTYIWYANEHEGPGVFKVVTDTAHVSRDLEQRYAEARRAGLAIGKGKVFLATWRQNEEHRVVLPHKRKVPSVQIRGMILRGLHRLYEEGFEEGDFQIDIEGIALDLGVPTALVVRALGFLYSEGLIDDYGTLGRNRSTGDVWLTPKGVQYVEAQRMPVEAFLQELYRTTLGRLSSVDPNLAASFERLRERAASAGASRQDLVGFASMVRDFLQELTDHLYAEKGLADVIPREQTVNKVRAITAAATSDTSRKHVRALAEVVETHWRRLNEVQQKAVHSGAVESQRLFAYTLLFVADLFDVVARPS